MTRARAAPKGCERTNTSKQSALRRHPERADVDMPRTAKSFADEIDEIWNAADREGRDLTSAERIHVSELVVQAKGQQDIEKSIQEIGLQLGPAGGNVVRFDGSHTGGGPGDVFIASKGYQKIADPSLRGQQWSTGPVEVSSTHILVKGTMLETGVGGPGGGPVPPFYQPGIVDKLFEPLGVRDVFGQSTTTASQVRYVVEGTALSGAAGVAEAGAKPESTIAMSEVVEPVKKIATTLPISDELLEDAPSIQSYLNGRLSLFVSIEEERQLLRGTGTNELIGLFNRTGGQAINLYTRLAADDNTVALAKVIANTRGSSFLQPDCIVLHPTNWLNSRLLRDGTGGTAGQYFGGGPFGGAYGNGGAPGLFGESLWNTRVVLSTVVGLGTALVGNFGQGAHVYRRGGVSVEATNSHSDLFVKDITMLRAEERLGLGLYRPAAFTAVSGLA
jgi:HK97 family phage major capsid protein